MRRGLDLQLSGHERLKRLIALCLVVLDVGTAEARLLAANGARGKLARRHEHRVAGVVFLIGRVGQAIAAEMDPAHAGPETRWVEAARLEIVVRRLGDFIRRRRFEEEVQRFERTGLALRHPEARSGLGPKRRRAVDVVGVRPRIRGAAVSAGVQLEHSGAAMAGLARLAEHGAADAVPLRLVEVAACGVHADP